MKPAANRNILPGRAFLNSIARALPGPKTGLANRGFA